MGKKNQEGITLIWSMVIMLVMSLLGIVSSQSASFERVVSTNAVLQKLAYQGAESAIMQVSDRSFLIDTVKTGTPNADGNLEKTFPETTVGKISTEATIEFLGSRTCSSIPKLAMSTELTEETGGVTCQVFRIKGQGSVLNTGARDIHEVGITQFVPVKNEVEL